jgi:arginyl-tRNA synthetase
VVANLLRASGANVLRANNINDRGIHIVQSMLSYLTWGNGESPSDTGEKGDHFVGRYYVMFHKEADRLYSEWLSQRGLTKDSVPEDRKKDIKKEFDRQCPFVQHSYEMLSRWEAGDPEVLSLWRKMNEWVYAGFDQTNGRLGFWFEKVYYESNTYKLGKEIIFEQLAMGVGQRAEDGSLAIDLKNPKLSKRPITLLRADGTSVYITQDVGLAVTRFQEIAGLSGVVYVVAREQEFHFKCLFEILRQYGYPWHSRLFHLSYGMVNLPSGKMKSREGTVVDADDLVDQLHSVATSIIRKNEPDAAAADVERRAEAVALGALKYMLASTSPHNDIMFDVEKSVSFEGNTGPYLQYACVRISAIEEKAGGVPVYQDSGRAISDLEFEVVKMICFYPEAVQNAAATYDPSVLASYLYETAKSFSGFYADCPVVHDGRADAFRLAICKTTKQVLSNGLDLLGIPIPDRM